MSGASQEFLLFALATVLVLHAGRGRLWRQAVLLLASLAFLGLIASPVELTPVFGFTLFGFGCLWWLQNRGTAGMPYFAAVVLILFVWLKKYTFLPASTFLPFPYLSLGLSYILFRVLHLVIDSGNGALPEKVGFLQYLTYTLNFTTFVSGPIQRFPDFKRMLDGHGSRVDATSVGLAAERLVKGLFKVRVLALLSSTAHKQAIATVISRSAVGADGALAGVVVFVSYAVFLYVNFSGYIDVVLAIAGLMGFTLPENFANPFAADSFIDFWNRWHITLSTWLKEYVYMPMLTSLMRRYPEKAVAPYLGIVAYFVTFFLVGVWHGQNSTFAFFGVLQGLGVAVNKLFQVLAAKRLGRAGFRKLSDNPLWCAVGRGLTFTWFTFSLTWFWSDWASIRAIYSSLSTVQIVLCWSGVFVAATIVLSTWEAVRALVAPEASPVNRLLVSRYPRTAWTTVLVIVVAAMGILLDQPVPEIVYGKF